MVIPDLFFSLAMAFIFGLIIAVILRRRLVGADFFRLFLLIFLAIWAGGIWLGPFGPSLWGFYWLPFLLVGLFLAALFSFLSFKQAPREPVQRLDRSEILDRRETLELLDEIEREKQTRQIAFFSLGLFFWLKSCWP